MRLVYLCKQCLPMPKIDAIGALVREVWKPPMKKGSLAQRWKKERIMSIGNLVGLPQLRSDALKAYETRFDNDLKHG